MPWLSQVAGVVDAWYPGQTSGTSLASVLFGQTDPGGHLPVTFPACLSQVPASAPRRSSPATARGAVLRGHRRRLPLVRREEHHAAVPVRVRAVVHDVRVQQPAVQPGTAERHAGRAGVRHGHQHRAAGGQRRGAAVPRRPGRRRRAAAPARGVPAGDAGARASPRGSRSPSRRSSMSWWNDSGERLDADLGHVPGLRRRLLGAGQPAAAGRVHHGDHAGPPARSSVSAPSTMQPGQARRCG